MGLGGSRHASPEFVFNYSRRGKVKLKRFFLNQHVFLAFGSFYASNTSTVYIM